MFNLMIARSTESLYAKAKELQLTNLISATDFRLSLLSDFTCDGSNLSGILRGRHILAKLKETKYDGTVYVVSTVPILTHPLLKNLPSDMNWMSDNFWVEVDKGRWMTLRSRDGVLTCHTEVSSNQRIISCLGLSNCERINSYFKNDSNGDGRVAQTYVQTPANWISFETMSNWISEFTWLLDRVKDIDVFIDADGDLGIELETAENNHMTLKFTFRNGTVDLEAYNMGELDVDKENLSLFATHTEVKSLFGEKPQ